MPEYDADNDRLCGYKLIHCGFSQLPTNKFVGLSSDTQRLKELIRLSYKVFCKNFITTLSVEFKNALWNVSLVPDSANPILNRDFNLKSQ